MKIPEKVRKFLRDQREVLWIALAVAVLYGTWKGIGYVDPRSGLDGFGSLFNYLLLLILGALASWLAWVCKRLYWHDLSEDEETDLRAKAKAGDRHAKFMLILDRSETLAWLAFWLFVFLR